MSGTPESQKNRVVAYYEETTEASYLKNWSGAALSFHFGLADEETKSLDEAHLAANAFVADRLEVTSGTRVLDAGCGVGGTSIWLAQHRAAVATGVTLEPGQVALGTRFAAERGVGERVSLLVADYLATPFSSGSFEVALNLESLCHCTSLRDYFAHVHDLLAPGGRYGCLEFFAGDGRPDLVREVMDTWAMPSWERMGTVESALCAAGFEEVRAEDMTARVQITARQMQAMARNSVLVSKLQHAIDGESHPVMEAHVRGAIACCEGLLHGGITYGFVRAAGNGVNTVPLMTPSLEPRARWLPRLIAFAAIVLFAIATKDALRWYGHPFASVLVDPDARVSGVGSKAWEGVRLGLRFPDRILTVDGTDLTARSNEHPAQAFDRAIEAAASTGRKSVHVEVRTAREVRAVELPVIPFDALEWWTLSALMFLAGSLYVVAALTAIVASPRGPLARTFAKTALVCAVFMFSFFDAHTTRHLVPFLWASFALTPGAFVALALRLPDDAPILRRFPRLVTVIDAAGLAFAVVMNAYYFLNLPTTQLRSTCSLLLGVSQIFFVVTFVVRFLLARRERRKILGALLVAIAPPHALVGAGILLALMSPHGAAAAIFISLSIPILSLLPIFSVVAFLRHDLWGSRTLVSRVGTLTVAGAVAFVLSSGLGAAFVAYLGVPFPSAILGATSGALAAAGIVTLALRLSDRRFFRSRAEYKPTIEHLSEDLTSLTDPVGVARAVERVVRRSLSCDEAIVVLHPTPDEATTTDALALGQELSVPLVLGRETLGFLRAKKSKLADAPFTSEDRDLLRTIANQAALAVAYTRSYRELEDRRRVQVEAWRGEREALVETVAAEVAHEIRYPINFFRAVFQREGRSSSLTPEEVDIGREEVDRLERLTAGLRRLEHRRLERRIAHVSDIVARADLLLRDALGARRLEVDVPAAAAIRTDVEQLTQVIVNLVSNAVDAIDENGHVGVEWRLEPNGAAIVVWDSGPGFEGDAASLFTPWFTTKAKGTGLGLAISHRIVRAHGWSIDARRAAGRTEFIVSIASGDVVRRMDLVNA